MTAPARTADSPVPDHDGAAGQPNGPEAPRAPRRNEGSGRKPQDAELKDYQLGDCLGRGAFGSVFRALNMNTAETVAVKQIKLADLPKSELRVITLEIDLLKNLDHPNIVKYHGSVKTSESLNIILEYCENGSLHSISKNFGKFPEHLVGLYMSQILHGLVYLHEQGVIHRDIKGANILTTKQGLVKLADFGVATRTTTLNESSVVGTPYWMAPEVIELSGATTASDIWSLGCTVIELLDGKPPYHKLQPMHALFRIVNDDHPPIPDGASPVVRDFLMQCFQKDHNLRVSARKLLKHPWIVSARKADAAVPKKSTEYEEAVKSVQQWNEALKSPTSTLRKPTKTAVPSPGLNGAKRERSLHLITPSRTGLGMAKPRPMADQFRSPDGQADNNWDDDFDSEIDPGALQLPHLRPQDQFGGLLSAERLKSFASFETVTDNANWDQNTDTKPQSPASAQDPLKTVRPFVILKGNAHESKKSSPVKSPKRRPSQATQSRSSAYPLKGIKESPKPSRVVDSQPTLQYREDPIEDYSDLVLANDGAFDAKLTLNGHKNDLMSPRLFHPSDLTGTPRSIQLQQSIGGPQSIRNRRTSIRRTQSEVEIQRYAENEQDEDFSCLLGQGKNDKQDSEKCSESGTLMLNSKLSNKSWLGDDDNDDDPFALLEEEFDETDLEANVARDKYARLCTQVEGLVGSLKVEQADDTLADLSEDLLEVLCDTPEIKSVIVTAHGMLPVLEILESCRRPNVIHNLLRAVNMMIYSDVELQENLCFVGGIPIITQYTSKKFSSEIRLEAAAFVRQMCQTSLLTLQMFVSAGGLKVLVEFLEEDYEDERELVLIGVNGVWNVFELTGPLKNEFCRILSRSQVLVPLSLVLSRVLDERGEIAELCEGRIANIFLLFSQAENHVKELVAERAVLHRVLKELKRMSPRHQVTMLKFVKNISMLSTTLDTLESSNAIDVLTDLLRNTMNQPHFRDVSNQVLNTIYNLCRLNKHRQGDAALNDIIPLLQRIYKTDRPLKEFTLPILCDMAHSGNIARRELWRNKGLQFYVSLLAEPYWQVTALDSIFVWLQEETARVQDQLLRGNFTQAIMDCFITAKANAFENLLEPLQKLLRLSPPIALSLAQPEFFRRVLQKLDSNKAGSNKALTRLNLLRIIQSICDASDEQGALIHVYGLYDTIQRLAESDSAILVRDMASKLTRSCDEQDLLGRSGGKRRGGVRRTSTSTTPPGINGSSSQSMPPTPTSTRSSHTTSYFTNDRDRRSIVNGPMSSRAARNNITTSNNNNHTTTDESLASTAAMSNSNSPASGTAASRLPRTTSTRNANFRPNIRYSTPRRDEAGSPTPAGGSNGSSAGATPASRAAGAVPASRRRRPTNSAESRGP